LRYREKSQRNVDAPFYPANAKNLGKNHAALQHARKLSLSNAVGLPALSGSSAAAYPIVLDLMAVLFGPEAAHLHFRTRHHEQKIMLENKSAQLTGP
jgi:hypothetical protein